MIKSLNDARITDALPRIVAGQDWVIALSEALGTQHENMMRLADNSQIYTALDTVSEEILDALAVCWKVDWYDTDYSIERKRRIIKTAMAVRRLMGTVYATRLQADAIVPGTQLEEWFDYGGEPGTFRLYVNMTDSSEESPLEDYDTEEMERRLVTAKRWSAQLESMSYMVRHVIGIRLTLSRWDYGAPACGAVTCGTYWTQATLGRSDEKGIQSGSSASAYGYEMDFAGTLPETATSGSSISGIAGYDTEAVPYTAGASESGIANSGTIPEMATPGDSISSPAGYTVEAESYTAEVSESGLLYSGALE